MKTPLINTLAVLALVAFGSAGYVQAQGRSVPPQPVRLNLNFEKIGTVGVTPGETLRVSVFNPHEIQDGTSNTIMLSERGTTLFDSGDITVPPLETVFFDISGDDSSLDAFRDASGRVQLSVKVKFPWLPAAGPRRIVPLHEPFMAVAVELIDADTGRTTAHITMKDRNILQN